MAKSIKLSNNTFIDSTDIVYNRQLLSNLLKINKYTVSSYLVNDWVTNGSNQMFNVNGIKVLVISVRYGSSRTIINSLPSDMRPTSGELLIPATDQTNGGWVSISTNGVVSVKQTLATTQIVNFIAVYY